MKNTFLIVALLGFFATTANAQYVGIKGGLNLSNLSFGDEVTDNNMRFGYHFGGYLHLPVSDGFGFQPEVLYSTKGASADYEYDVLGIQGEGSSSFNLNYLDVPLLGVFKFGDVAEIHLGPYIGFLMNSSVSTEGDLGDGQEDLDRDNFKSVDFGLAGGLAFNFSALQLGARYNYGLQKIENSDAAKAILGDATNSYIQVFAALRLGAY